MTNHAFDQGGRHELEETEGSATARSATDPAPESELPERWSAQRKIELVLRLLRGEALDALPRESQVPGHELENWKRVFLETGPRGLESRAELEERELTWRERRSPNCSSKKPGLADEWKRSRRWERG